jgi:MOSC domain-containing protein YiiM
VGPKSSIGVGASAVRLTVVRHRTTAELEAGLDHIRRSPIDGGQLELIVARPAIGERKVLTTGELSMSEGLVGDTWDQRPSTRTADGGPHPDMQLNIINARLSALIAEDQDHRALAGDQLHVDLDLSHDNLPAGTRLAIGGAVIEITDQPHTGCVKFANRFGKEALRFVNIGEGKQMRLRGLNAKVVTPGVIRVGDEIRRL